MTSLRILIGCATSCVALNAMLARGHDAWQCDLLPADQPTNRHIQGDVRDHLGDGWDLLIICNPPCTRLCNSGVRWLSVPPTGRTKDEMWAELDEAVALFTACWRAPVPRVALENPVMHKHARERMPADLPRPQIVQPWWFGDPAFKATGLYTRGLPPLSATKRLVPPKPGDPEHKAWSAIHRAPPGPDRWKVRSKTFAGMAEAWADQWAGWAKEREAA
jgi:hypothetical protein